MNLAMSFGSSDEEEEKNFSGAGLKQVARVSFDPNSQQVVGWETIWAKIEGEEEEKKSMEQKLQQGVNAYSK